MFDTPEPVVHYVKRRTRHNGCPVPQRTFCGKDTYGRKRHISKARGRICDTCLRAA